MQVGFKKVLLVTAVAVLSIVYFFVDARKGGFPQCPFHLLTGWFCPGCGSQRALSSLLHGNVFEAMHNNILMVAFLPFLLYSAFVNLRYADARKMKLLYAPFFVKVVLVTIICFWVIRNIPHHPFFVLAPLN